MNDSDSWATPFHKITILIYMALMYTAYEGFYLMAKMITTTKGAKKKKKKKDTAPTFE